MKVTVVGDSRFVEPEVRIEHVDDALALVSACIENDSDAVLLEASVLPDEFYDLSSRFAGEFVQKLLNYRLRVAAVLDDDVAWSDRFKEFVAEARRGTGFRTFESRAAAESWLSA